MKLNLSPFSFPDAVLQSSFCRSRVLAAYRWHPGFQYRIKERGAMRYAARARAPKAVGPQDFHVDLGFGLHCGWAIEAHP